MAAVVVAVLVIAGFVANSITLDEYVLSPGVAQPVGPLITVPPGVRSSTAAEHSSDVYLTDVYETHVRALEWPLYALNGDDRIYSTQQLFGPSPPPPAKIEQQQLLLMAIATENARVEALRYLGYKVPERTGPVVVRVVPGSPAAGLHGLQRGDAIVAVDGKAVQSVTALTGFLAAHHPGQRVTLTVRHVDGARTTSPLVLGHAPGRASKAFMGVELTQYHYFDLPFRIGINSEGIGGPSAGLAFTLGIINQLTGGHLTGGRRVAATGTMDLQGKVGLVGGVPQKTIAVEDAGATVFLVPPGNEKDALSKAGHGLKVVPVATLGQALSALRRLGGQVPPPRSGKRSG